MASVTKDVKPMRGGRWHPVTQGVIGRKGLALLCRRQGLVEDHLIGADMAAFQAADVDLAGVAVVADDQ